jgi:dolichol kinase
MKHSMEFKRKAFHSFAALYALGATFLSRSFSIRLFLVLLVFEGLVETTRLVYSPFNEWLFHLFKGIYREQERKDFSGVFWALAGTLTSIILIPNYRLAIMGIWYLTVGDGLAGLVGKTWGRHPIGDGPKTWEGTFACFAGCWLIGAIVLWTSASWWLPFIGALAACFIELLPMPGDDNFWLPILSSVCLYLFSLAGNH